MYRSEEASHLSVRYSDVAAQDDGRPSPASIVQRVRRIGLSWPGYLLKRLFDLISVVVILALFGWLMLIIAGAVRLSSGSNVIYGHTRVGRKGRQFQCYKFRSMVSNSDDVLRQLLETDPEAREQWERDFKLKDDPRITRIGRFIRRTSLDELPQLWNVLKGDMSVVGPRPVVQAEFDQYYGNARQHYLSVSPGLTGLWQVSGRSDLDYEQRVQLDKTYVENWNVFSDFLIVMRTVKVMVVGRGAY
jgi:Undecaprenyl-phosphate galactose phosphotransferase WbaP